MMSLSRRFRPDHLAGQLAILILVAIVFFHVSVTIAVRLFDLEPPSHLGKSAEVSASYLLAIDLAPVSERQHLISEFSRVTPWATFSIRDDRPDAIQSTEPITAADFLRKHLWPDADAFLLRASPNTGIVAVAVALRKGGYAIVSTGRSRGAPQEGKGSPPEPRGGRGPPPTFVWIGSALFFFLCATILTIWTSNAVVAPLVDLANKSERFPTESNEPDLIVERGPQEVRNLARALNRMQVRIRTMIRERAETLAAISHDLRTIITRMRLRTEFIGDDHLRQTMLHDVEMMDSMLRQNLAYLRNDSGREKHDRIDLDSVLQTVADQFSELGHDVTYRGVRGPRIIGSLTDTQRVFNNLVENAVYYAGSAVITVEEPSPDIVQIDVADEGPGITSGDKARLIEPFVRGDRARNMNERVGFGLGLSIVTSLLMEVGGTLQLLDREPHGLVARVIFPKAPKSAPKIVKI
jgi:signal transduction histidine kinase